MAVMTRERKLMIALIPVAAIGVVVLAGLTDRERPAADVATRIPSPGTSVTLKRDAMCLPTEETLDEAVKWASRGDSAEMMRVIRKSGGSVLENGRAVKVLEPGILRTQVRPLPNGRECWLVPEALGNVIR